MSVYIIYWICISQIVGWTSSRKKNSASTTNAKDYGKLSFLVGNPLPDISTDFEKENLLQCMG